MIYGGAIRSHIGKAIFFLLAATVLLISGCKKDAQPRLLKLFDESKPLVSIGTDVDNPKAKAYKMIQHYGVDHSGNIFIGSVSETTIDKYDPKGRFLFSFGRKGQGPGEFEGTVPAFAVNSKGEIYTFSLRQKFIIFNPDGSLKKEVPFPHEAELAHIGLIKIDPADNVHVIFYSADKGVFIAKFSSDLDNHSVYHRKEARRETTLSALRFLPDLDFNQTCKVYVTDSYDYRIYVYSSNGKLVQTIEKPSRREKIIPKDLILFSGKGQELMDFSKDSNALAMLRGLSEKDCYLPNIFGINITDNGFIVWTTERDAEFKYIIDIFDMDSQSLGRSSEYNSITQNMAVVRGNRIYLPNLRCDDMGFKKKIGRLSLFEVPTALFMYELEDRD